MTFDSEYPLIDIKKDKRLLFLAGSIDLELPGNWRESVVAKLEDDFNFFDPTSLNHRTLSEEEWAAHIKWELLAMEMSDCILLNCLPSAKSPISLIELGLNTIGNKLIVVCPDEFYKNQYIKLLCNHYSTPVFNHLNDAMEYIETHFNAFLKKHE